MDLLLFIFCIWMFTTCITWCPQRPAEAVQSSGNGDTDGLEPPCGAGSRLSEEAAKLLTADPFL